MPPSRLPTIVLSHGAWHTPAHYTTLLSALRARGYPVVAPLLPSVNATLASFDADVATVRAAITAALATGTDVVLLMHSYGGVVGGEACAGLLAKTSGPGVVALVCLCAFALPRGQSLLAMVGGEPLPWWLPTEDGAAYTPGQPRERFFNDVPDKKLVEAMVAGLGTQSQGALRSRTTGEPWREVRSAYLLCERDGALPVGVQEKIVEEVGITEVRRVEAGHDPWFARLEETVGFVVDAIEGRV